MANPMGRQWAQQPRVQKISVKEFAAKYNTKREVYKFLVVDGARYCPPIDTVSIWHLKEMASGKKGSIRLKDIDKLVVPNYEELTIERIVEWAQRHHTAFCNRYFPLDRELLRFPRQVSWPDSETSIL